MKDFLKKLFIGLGGVLTATLNTLFIKKQIPQPFGLIAAAALGVTLTIVLEHLFIHFPMRFTSIRRYFEPAARYEGLWVIEPSSNTEGLYGYAWLCYNPSTNRYSYNGVQINENGDIYSQWSTIHTLFDSQSNTLRYFWSGRKQADESSLYTGHGQINFLINDSGKCSNCDDFWIQEHGNVVQKYTCRLERFSPIRQKKILGHKGELLREDRLKLLWNYYKVGNKTQNELQPI